MKNLDRLLCWMYERENIRIRKDAGLPKPWTSDEVFQRVYFCNVHREDDKVTRFIREMYSPYVNHPMFEFNIILARFLNWPDTLTAVGYIEQFDPEYINTVLHGIKGKVWGNAYVVTTHGMPMDKIDYLTNRVLASADCWQGGYSRLGRLRTCEDMAKALMLGIEGVSTFMAGQVVADLKNTKGHPLMFAFDWWTFALPGPGSRRGMDWLMGEHITDGQWLSCLHELQDAVKLKGWKLCAQDLQNCLCEFDKYMRVSTGSGRSKRQYQGA